MMWWDKQQSFTTSGKHPLPIEFRNSPWPDVASLAWRRGWLSRDWILSRKICTKSPKCRGLYMFIYIYLFIHMISSFWGHWVFHFETDGNVLQCGLQLPAVLEMSSALEVWPSSQRSILLFCQRYTKIMTTQLLMFQVWMYQLHLTPSNHNQYP